MCGIVGYIANRKHGFNNGEVKAVKEMLHINALRGVDSTGVYYINNRLDVQVHKELGDSPKFLKTNEWESTERELFRNGQAIVGHCRAATKGAKSDENAHPFIVDNRVVLVHNGTYMGSHDHIAKTEVDSHAIAHALAETDDIAEALRRINAAYALVWYNTETKMLHAVRNKHRPLWFGLMEDGSMMFASEPGFIYTTAWRNDLKLQKGQPTPLDEHTLFSCDLSDISKPYMYEAIDCEYVAPPPPPKKEEPRQVESKSQTPLSLVPHTPGKGLPPSLTEIAKELGIGKVVHKGVGSTDFFKLAGPGTKLFVEADDYRCVDEEAGMYYIYGKVMSSNEELNGMIAGWEIKAESEYSVVEYVYGKFYDCTVEYNISLGVLKPGSLLTSVWKMKEAVLSTTVPLETMELNA